MHGHRHSAAAPGSRASARTGSTAGETVFGRILAGKKPQWTGRLGQPHTFHYLPDMPADWWFSPTGEKPMGRSGIFPRRRR